MNALRVTSGSSLPLNQILARVSSVPRASIYFFPFVCRGWNHLKVIKLVRTNTFDPIIVVVYVYLRFHTF